MKSPHTARSGVCRKGYRVFVFRKGRDVRKHHRTANVHMTLRLSNINMSHLHKTTETRN